MQVEAAVEVVGQAVAAAELESATKPCRLARARTGRRPPCGPREVEPAQHRGDDLDAAPAAADSAASAGRPGRGDLHGPRTGRVRPGVLPGRVREGGDGVGPGEADRRVREGARVVLDGEDGDLAAQRRERADVLVEARRGDARLRGDLREREVGEARRAAGVDEVERDADDGVVDSPALATSVLRPLGARARLAVGQPGEEVEGRGHDLLLSAWSWG